MAVRCWLQDSLLKMYPTGNRPGARRLRLDAARGETVSFQAAFSNPAGPGPVQVRIAVDPFPGLSVRVRKIGYVPLPHHNTETPGRHLDCRGHVPGFVPDPLFDEREAVAARGETVAFWISVGVAPECAPGEALLAVRADAAGTATPAMEAAILVHNLVVRPRRDFPVTHWLYSDALLDRYGLDGFGPGYWRILERYLRNLAGHGQDVLYVPAFTPPLDGVKRPTQLLGVAQTAGGWRFDWSLVKRYTSLAIQCGIRAFEWTHLFSQWGARDAIRVYQGRGEAERLLWRPETAGTSETYRRFLAAYLPRLRAFLDREGLRDRSLFHVSDEPQGPEALSNYRAAREMLRILAPWMKTMDALSDPVYGREGITDMPVASIAEVSRFAREGIPCWGYFCCGPRGAFLNRLLDTPLAKVRMSGWLFRRFRLRGFLHWGANYWYRRATRTLIDPYVESSGGDWPTWSYGDPFVLYPGPEGPVDSIRWEVFAESLGDYALLQTLGIEPGDRLLAPIAGFDRFPCSVSWLRAARARLLAPFRP
jgi:hypothetical protein